LIEVASAQLSTRFLFRTDQGLIGQKTWWIGSLWLGAIFALLSTISLLLSPYTRHDLAKTPLLDWHVIAAYLYLTFYIFALILIAICFYNLSAKRWRDRGKPSALAGLLPFFALLSGAVHWLYPQLGDEIPIWSVIATDAVFVALLLWTIVELGVLPSKPYENS
jgi:uncharacterized membrane protein YhaH (DUF805 family)